MKKNNNWNLLKKVLIAVQIFPTFTAYSDGVLVLTESSSFISKNPSAKYEMLLSLDIHMIYVPSGSCSEFCSSPSLVSHHVFSVEISLRLS